MRRCSTITTGGSGVMRVLRGRFVRSLGVWAAAVAVVQGLGVPARGQDLASELEGRPAAASAVTQAVVPSSAGGGERIKLETEALRAVTSAEAQKDDLQDVLENSDIRAIETQAVAAEAFGADTSDVEEVTAPTVFREKKILETAIERLRFGRNLGNGIVIVRRSRGTASSPSWDGYTGLMRTVSAEMSDQYSFRFGGHLSFYHSSLLWDSVRQTHMDAVGFFAYSILPALEVRASANAVGHSSGRTRQFVEDPLFQILGDLTLGGKYSYSLLPYLNVMGLVDFKFYTGIRQLGPRFDSFSNNYVVGATLDFRQMDRVNLPFPLRIHSNVGYFLDQSWKLTDGLQVKNASSYFGMGLSPGDKLELRMGIEVPEEIWAAYLEYSTEQVVNRRDENVRINRWGQSPSRFTPGARYNPVENIILDASLDLSFGLQKVVKVYDSLQPSGPPYGVNLGVSYEWNPEGWGVYDLRGQIQGIVVDADTGEPVGGTIVEYVDATELSPQIAMADSGEFRSYRLPPGKVRVKLWREDYEAQVIETTIVSREAIDQKYFLRRSRDSVDDVGAISGMVTDREGKPVVATINFDNASLEPMDVNPDGSYMKLVAPGTYTLRFVAEGFEDKVYEVPVETERKTRLDVQMVSRQRAGAFAGRIVDQDGKPLSGVIRFLDVSVDPLQADARGEFFRVLPTGTYKVEFSLEGYMPKLLEVPVAEGKKTTLEVFLETEVREGAFGGRILSTDNKPLAGLISFDAPNITPVPSDPETGEFLKILTAGNYIAIVQAPGHETKRFEVPVMVGKKTMLDLVVPPLLASSTGLARIEGDRIVTEIPISFEPGTDLLTEQSIGVLNDVARLASQDNVPHLVVESHTNNLGPSEANKQLSQGRAEAVVTRLLELGVPQSKLEAIGVGEDKPTTSNDTPDGRARNERIELILR